MEINFIELTRSTWKWVETGKPSEMELQKIKLNPIHIIYMYRAKTGTTGIYFVNGGKVFVIEKLDEILAKIKEV